MDGPIALLARQIPSLIDASKSDSTLRKYKTYFSKFQNWCKLYDLDSLPASASTVSLYIFYLVQANSSSSVLTDLFPNPCKEKMVNLLRKEEDAFWPNRLLIRRNLKIQMQK